MTSGARRGATHGAGRRLATLLAALGAAAFLADAMGTEGRGRID